MNFNFSKKMFINRNIDGFKITINKTIRDAIKNIKENKGLPLIIINNSHEFLGTLIMETLLLIYLIVKIKLMIQ